ncbi:MAG: insulinase family protein, partial [Acidobacteriota bacterium]
MQLSFSRGALRFLLAPLSLLLAGLIAAGCTPIDSAEIVNQPPPVPAVSPAADPAPETPKADSVAPTISEEAAFDPATAPLEAEIPVDDSIRVGTLENGLRYYIRANRKPEQRAELRLSVNAGSILEDEDQLGLAHYVEHMAFNGTENFEKSELVDYLQRVGMRFGADINASTGFDETSYMLTVPTDNPELLDTAFLVLGDWAGRVSFDPEEVEKERGVIIEEWRLSQGAGMRLFDRQMPAIFGGSRYLERLPIGTKESIETAPAAALARFYKDWYRPDLQAIIAVGDFDVDQVEGLIRKHLGGLPATENPRPRETFSVPDHEEPRISIETDPELTGTSVTVLFKHGEEEGSTVGDYRRGLVEGLYNQMFNARLGELSQQADPPFVFASSSGGALVRGGYAYQLDARVKEDAVIGGLESVLTEVERVDRHGFTEGELERAKREVLRGYEQLFKERDKLRSGSFAAEYQRHFYTGEPIPGIEAEVAFANRFVPEVELEEINRLGRKYITDENRVILVSAPEAVAAQLPAEATLLAAFDAAEKGAAEPWVDQTRDEPHLAQKPTPGSIVETVEYAELGVTEWRLSNGVRVVLKPTDFQNDQVAFAAFSPGGNSLVADADFTSSNFATFLLGQSGLGNFNAIELQKTLAGKVASASPFISELQEGLAGGGSPEDLETAFQMSYLWFTEPRMDQDAFRNFFGRMSVMIENRSKNPMTVFGDTLNEHLSGGHFRRRPLTTEVLKELDADRALAVYRERFADASDFTFVMVGNFEVDKVRPLVETYWGSLPNLEREEVFRDIGVEFPEGVVEFEVKKGLEPKSLVNLTYHGPARWVREDRFALRALSRVLEIRLTELVREEMGATYSVGVRSSLSRWPKEYFNLTVTFGCNPDETERILKVLFADFETLRQEGPDSARVDKVKENLRRQRELQLMENSFWLSALQTYYEHDLDLGLLLKFDDLLEGLTAEALH